MRSCEADSSLSDQASGCILSRFLMCCKEAFPPPPLYLVYFMRLVLNILDIKSKVSSYIVLSINMYVYPLDIRGITYICGARLSFSIIGLYTMYNEHPSRAV